MDYITLEEGLLTEIKDRAAESAVQNQTARMCSLILFYTVRKTNEWARLAGKGMNLFHKR